MDAKTKAALEVAERWLSDYWANRGRYGAGSPDPTDAINEIRDVLGLPKIIDLLKAANG